MLKKNPLLFICLDAQAILLKFEQFKLNKGDSEHYTRNFAQ